MQQSEVVMPRAQAVGRSARREEATHGRAMKALGEGVRYETVHVEGLIAVTTADGSGDIGLALGGQSTLRVFSISLVLLAARRLSLTVSLGGP